MTITTPLHYKGKAQRVEMIIHNIEGKQYRTIEAINDRVILQRVKKDLEPMLHIKPIMVKNNLDFVAPEAYKPQGGKPHILKAFGMYDDLHPIEKRSDVGNFRVRLSFTDPTSGHKYETEAQQAYDSRMVEFKGDTLYLRDYGFLHFSYLALNTGYDYDEYDHSKLNELRAASKLMDYTKDNIMKCINTVFGVDIISELTLEQNYGRKEE